MKTASLKVERCFRVSERAPPWGPRDLFLTKIMKQLPLILPFFSLALVIRKPAKSSERIFHGPVASFEEGSEQSFGEILALSHRVSDELLVSDEDVARFEEMEGKDEDVARFEEMEGNSTVGRRCCSVRRDGGQQHGRRYGEL